jgi:flavin reductase (DIM6/NTAB) family NADH-FMN oxidoreductase RutF
LSVDARTFRDALARFASGVCVVTGIARDGGPVGITISSFASLSLEPPLVLFCIDRKASACEAYARGLVFAVNVLAEDQRPLSDLFAGRETDRFAAVAGEVGANGCRLLAGCLAGIECRREATLEGGDHFIVVGRVERIVLGPAAGPLVWFDRRYLRLGAAI